MRSTFRINDRSTRPEPGSTPRPPGCDAAALRADSKPADADLQGIREAIKPLVGGHCGRMSVGSGGFLLDSGALGDECLNGWRHAGASSSTGRSSSPKKHLVVGSGTLGTVAECPGLCSPSATATAS